jgi:hypothetical protein
VSASFGAKEKKVFARFIPVKQPNLAALLIALLLWISPGAEAQQCPAAQSNPQPLAAVSLSPSNNQYFRYNNQTVPLIGLSSEYLCHVAQPGTFTRDGITVTPDQAYCTWANYPAFIDRLAQSGLNTLRLWIGLNHSPGLERNLAAPYANEQPFAYNSGLGKWDLNTPDTVYWDRLKCVIGYAGTKGVIVEVTLFDPWSGDWTKGPWRSTKNIQGIGFTQKAYFGRYVNDPTRTDDPANAPARTEQEDLVRYAVSQLNAYPNLIWELANEAELPPGIGAPAGRWQNRIAQVLIGEEALPGRIEHPFIAEVHTEALSAVLLNAVNNPYLNAADVVAAHYVTVEPGAGDYGAIELIRTKQGLTGYTTRAFGFNETRSTPDPSIPSSARSEAWEFAINEGGLYDNYNLQFRNSSGTIHADTNKVFTQLGVLKTFLVGLNLDSMSRDACGAGCWLSGQGAYKNPEPACGGWSGNKYWATMHSTNNYVAYFHHSKDTASSVVPINNFSRYEPPPAGCSYQETTLQFKPGVNGTYFVDWVNPTNGALLVPSINLGSLTAGVTYAVPSSPSYVYDVVLRIRKQ